MIEATFEAVVPTPAYAEFEAIVPRERSMPIINQERYFDTNGKYEIKSEEGTAMTKVDVEVDIRPAEFNDVNFYDYDGTILYSYSWEEFLEYNQLPPLPTHHEGLVCEGWTHTLEYILKRELPFYNIAATYNTDDGSNRLHIEAVSDGYVLLNLRPTVIGGVEIDWGDGEIEVTKETGKITLSHNYNVGKYIISIKKITGTTYFGWGVQATAGFSGFGVILYEANISDLEGDYSYYNLRSLRKISYPKNFKYSTGMFNNLGIDFFLLNSYIVNNVTTGCSIKNVVITPEVKFIGNSMLSFPHLTKIAIPNGIIQVGYYAFKDARFTNIYFPDSVEKIEPGCCLNCIELVKARLPEGLIEIKSSVFEGCVKLNGIIIPQSVTLIDKYAFYGTALKVVNLKNHTAIPTLSNTNAFGNISSPFQIVVPDNLCDEWIAATNWSEYADKIIKASEYVES